MIGVEYLLNEGAVEDELAPSVLGGLEVSSHFANGSDLGDIPHRTDVGLQFLSCVLG